MRSLLQSQMFAPEIPSDVHQLNRVERAAALPRRARRVCALAFERVLDRNQSGRRRLAPRSAQIVPDVREQHHVDVFENTFAHEVSLAGDELFGDARPKFDRAGKFGAFHLSLDCDRGGDV